MAKFVNAFGRQCCRLLIFTADKMDCVLRHMRHGLRRNTDIATHHLRKEHSTYSQRFTAAAVSVGIVLKHILALGAC